MIKVLICKDIIYNDNYSILREYLSENNCYVDEVIDKSDFIDENIIYSNDILIFFGLSGLQSLKYLNDNPFPSRNLPIILFYYYHDEHDFQEIDRFNNIEVITNPFSKDCKPSLSNISFALKTLDNQKKRNQIIMKAIPDIVFHINKAGIILDVKENQLNTMVQRPEEIINKHFSVLKFDNDLIEKISTSLRKSFIDNEIQSIEYSMLFPNGLCFFEARIIPTDKEIALFIVRNVTTRKKFETALKKSQNNYRMLFDALSEIVHVVDTNFNFVLVNKTCATWIKNIGYNSDITGKNIFDVFYFLNDKEKTEYQYVIDSRNIHTTEEEKIIGSELISTITRKIPIIENDKIVNILTIIRNVTNNRRMEKIQQVLYRISVVANSSKDIKELLQKVRLYLGSITNTDNFYVALYNEKEDNFYLPFEIDQKDTDIIPSKKSLTSLVYRSEKSILLKENDIIELEKKGKIESIGTRAKVWLGVPLSFGHKTMGVIAVQNYNNQNIYSNNDLQIFEFTSYEIARAIEIKKTQEKINQNLREKEAMLQEIHHRVKNNLQIISSLLHIQSKSVEDEFSLNLLKESQNRVRSMAIIHQKLYENKDLSSVDFNSYTHGLTSYLLSSYRVDQSIISFKSKIKDIHLSLKTAIPCGLILNEILTNSLKYAFPDKRNGTIFIDLQKIGNGRFQLKIGDNGVGINKSTHPEKRKSLGMDLIEIFVQQINGAMQLESKNGVCYTIIFSDPYLKK